MIDSAVRGFFFLFSFFFLGGGAQPSSAYVPLLFARRFAWRVAKAVCAILQ